ncbi:hypothetical protein B0H16DRAFT_1900268 [Mycena metata]|uniref:Uncharacterized protein n=1 Tax=Mycena metata TaxID=1033252 RepID=A0AAD7MDI3_9AGAR|nr:hypothetical protein B0H16DRAFT_1900268 [Mycena metata]
MGYKAGITHVIRDLDCWGSKMHKKEVLAAVHQDRPLIVIPVVRTLTNDNTKSVASGLVHIRKYCTIRSATQFSPERRLTL